MRRTIGVRRLAVALVVFVLVALLVPQVVSGHHGPTQKGRTQFNGTPPTSSEPMPGSIAEAQEARTRRRESKEEKNARKASRRAHKNLSKREAMDLARREFRAMFAVAEPPLQLRDGESVKRYQGDSSAIIENEDGQRALAISDLPLRVEG